MLKVQIRVLKAVRDVLEREEGDDVLFRVEGQRAIMSKTPQVLDWAGSIAVPEDKRSAT